MSWFSEMMHPGRSYDKAQAAKDAYYNSSQGTRQPYIDRGERGGKSLEDMMNKLMNPGELQDEWSKNYKTSDYAKQLQEQSQTGGLDAASAMGLGGSSAALTNIQKGSNDIVSKDRQSYMDDMMKKYMAAMGIGGNLYGTGANAAENNARGQENQGEWTANNNFNKNQSGANMMQQILAMFGGSALGGGKGGAQPWQDPGSLPGWS
jgi:hypothetical protein